MTKKLTPEQAAANMAEAKRHAVGDNPNMEDMPYKSTLEVFPSQTKENVWAEQYQLPQAAKAALAPHVALATNAVRGGKQNQLEMQQEFKPFVDHLYELRLPDTQVNLGKVKTDIPWDITNYANNIRQEDCINLLFTLLGKERTLQLHKLSRLAGQEEKPTLWLALQLYVETKHPYVHQLRFNEELKAAAQGLDPAKHQLASEGVADIFGPDIYTALEGIANSAEFSVYQVFLILYSQIVKRELKAREPKISSGLWDILEDINNKEAEVA